MRKTTVSTYRKDTDYPRIVCAFSRILATTDGVSPVDVMIAMGNLTRIQEP